MTTKKCIICGREAKYCIKGTSDKYCKNCAEENFADLGYLQKLSENARKLRRFLINKDPPNYEG